MLIMLAIAITNKINLEIILFATSMILIYSSAGIQNAIKDKDIFPKKSQKIISAIPIIIAITISFQNIILLISTSLWIILGIAYNTTSRRILFADTTIIAITHYLMPITFSLLLLGKDLYYSLEIGIIFFSLFWFILPIKNLKEIQKDKKLNYKTLPTFLKNGKTITTISSIFFMIILMFLQISIEVNIILITTTILLYFTGVKLIKTNEKKSLEVFRLLFIFSIFTIITKTNNNSVIFYSSIIPILFSSKILKHTK